MGTHGVILFFEKCRLCFNKPGTTNIFHMEGLKQDVFDCTGVKVSDKESLPEKICPECLDVVLKAKELRDLAMKNDSYLKDLFCDEDRLQLPTQEDTDKNLNTELENSITETLTSSKKESVHSPDSQGLQVRKDLFNPTSSSSPIRPVHKEEQSSRKSKKGKVESGIVKNKCETCAKTFETYRKLYQHMRQHEKRFMCPLDACEKKFPTKGDLEKHLRTHTGVKPYSCDICDKRFTQMVSLRSHKENVHYCFTHIK